MSYSIEQFILDSGITRAEVDEAKARMLERMHMYGLKETHNKKAHEKEELSLPDQEPTPSPRASCRLC